MTRRLPESARYREQALAFFGAALEAVDPTRLVARHLQRDADQVALICDGEVVERWTGTTLVAGAGKAAARMAAGCERSLGPEHVRGTVVVTDGCGAPLQSIGVLEAGHPLPDARSAAGARRLREIVSQPGASRVLALISGGASALLALPRPPVSLEDKMAVTRLLLACGASIDELNTVRKHLSLIKGGGLLRAAAAPVIGLLVSDVVGDDPSTIGSGPTSPDPSTFAEAYAVLQRYELLAQTPHAVRHLLERGVAGQEPETVKPQTPEAARGRNVVIGSNRLALAAAADAARGAGWRVRIDSEPLTGDTTAAAVAFADRLRAYAGEGHRPLCVLAGGETTVRVRGTGRGGRNQEFALAMAAQIAGDNVVVLSAGTDGVDGPTDAAGAFVDGTTVTRAAGRGLGPQAALRNNDAYPFFQALGDLIRCGPTGTNVMDLKIALLPGADAPLSGSA